MGQQSVEIVRASTSLRGELPLAELGRQVLVGVDLDAAPPRTGRATLPERADLGWELDLAAQSQRHGHAVFGAAQPPHGEV
jgi:hypothetical protein